VGWLWARLAEQLLGGGEPEPAAGSTAVEPVAA